VTGRSAAALLVVGCIWGAYYLFIRVAVNDGVSTVQIVHRRCLCPLLLAPRQHRQRPGFLRHLHHPVVGGGLIIFGVALGSGDLDRVFRRRTPISAPPVA